MNDFKFLHLGQSLQDDYKQWLFACSGIGAWAYSDAGVQLLKIQNALETAVENSPEQQLAEFFSNEFVPDSPPLPAPFSRELPDTGKDSRVFKKTSSPGIQYPYSSTPGKRLGESDLSENSPQKDTITGGNITPEPAGTPEFLPEYQNDSTISAAAKKKQTSRQIPAQQGRSDVKPNITPRQDTEPIRDTTAELEPALPPVVLPVRLNTPDTGAPRKSPSPRIEPEPAFSTVKGMKDFASLVASPPAPDGMPGWQQQITELPGQIAEAEYPRPPKRTAGDEEQNEQIPVPANHKLSQDVSEETLPPDSILQPAPDLPDTDELMDIFSERITRAFYRFYG